MKTLSINLPDNIDEKEALMLLAVQLYESGKLSVGQAAKLVGYTKRTFLELMGSFGGKIFQQSSTDLKSDMDNA